MVQIHVSTHRECICLEGQVDTGRFPDRYRAVSLELWEEFAETARWQALPTAGGEVAWRALGGISVYAVHNGVPEAQGNVGAVSEAVIVCNGRLIRSSAR